ncbi:MAG: hypothetical protein OEV94_02530 [Deltaproteobacteria bacterium]|nr:hypothetical protein [Deltaproteobacteria bacterium]
MRISSVAVHVWMGWQTSMTHPLPRGLMLAVLGCFSLSSPAWADQPKTFTAQTYAYHQAHLALPLTQRVLPADEAVLDRQQQTNRDFGHDLRPKAASLNHPLAAEVKAMLEELPPDVRKLADRYLTAVYLVEGDHGTATTEAVRDKDGRWRLSYIVLNLSALDKTANQWGTWKESSAFRAAPGYTLRMTLETAKTDDLRGAIRFIFLHEMGHVVGQARGIHPSWEDSAPLTPQDFEKKKSVSILPISWRLENGKAVSVWKEKYPLLGQLDYYEFEKARLSLDQALKAYKSVAGSDFPSLYGATNLYDDFAESFVVYVHTRLLNKPYRVEVLRDGQSLFILRSCIERGTCTAKAGLVQAALAD